MNNIQETVKKYKILIAEDNILNQKLIVTLLTKNDYSVITVKNGEEAIDAFKKDCPDLVLMDVEMPVLNGYDAVLKIRESEKITNSHVPIIALTGHYLKEDIDNIFRCGMDDYLSKPIDFAKFLEKIVTFLEKQKIN